MWKCKPLFKQLKTHQMPYLRRKDEKLINYTSAYNLNGINILYFII